MTGLWTDRIFFGSAVFLVFGSLGDKVPQDFIDDRTKLRGAPFDVKAMAAALPHHRDQFRSQAALIEAQLAQRQKVAARRIQPRRCRLLHEHLVRPLEPA